MVPLGFPGWDKIESTFKGPEIYDPPQLKPGYVKYSWLNWLSHRSPVCARPVFPCCCVSCCLCCQPGTYYVDLLEPDDWFTKVLTTGNNTNFPYEYLKGIYWMEDNASGEVLQTFHDGNWETPSLGLKLWMYNWATDYSLVGWFMKMGAASAKFTLASRIEIAPNKKWIMLSGGPGVEEKPNASNTLWMYRLQPGDRISRPDGSELPWSEGDFMRVSFKHVFDPTSEIVYQYMARRVAYLDETGQLVKTPAYDELRRQTLAPHPILLRAAGTSS